MAFWSSNGDSNAQGLAAERIHSLGGGKDSRDTGGEAPVRPLLVVTPEASQPAAAAPAPAPAAPAAPPPMPEPAPAPATHAALKPLGEASDASAPRASTTVASPAPTAAPTAVAAASQPAPVREASAPGDASMSAGDDPSDAFRTALHHARAEADRYTGRISELEREIEALIARREEAATLATSLEAFLARA